MQISPSLSHVPSHPNPEDAPLHPRIKVGARARIHQRLREIACEVEPILKYLDGNHELDDISAASGLTRSRVEWLVNELHRAHLVDTRESAIVINDRQMSKVKARALRSKRSVPDEIFLQLQKKMAPELSLLTWRDGVDDGGVEMLSSRQQWEVEVSGLSRVLPSLLAILRSSGITQSHPYTTQRAHHNSVDVDDLAAGIFDISDIGGQYFARLHEKLKNYSLFGTGGEGENSPFLHIHFGTPSLEQSAQWLQRGEGYLVIREPEAGGIVIGPLVLPTGTPCLRCAELSAQDRGDVIDALTGYDIPVAQLHLVAGFVADQVLRFIDTGHCEVLGAEIFLDFLHPLSHLRREIVRHPRCGCAFA